MSTHAAGRGWRVILQAAGMSCVVAGAHATLLCKMHPHEAADRQRVRPEAGLSEAVRWSLPAGPGAYAKAEDNLDSVRDPAASLGTRFGKAHRDKSLLASLEPDRADKILQGSCSTAKMYDPDIHAKVVGKYRSPLTSSFTKTARLPAIKSGTPGPGAYVV